MLIEQGEPFSSDAVSEWTGWSAEQTEEWLTSQISAGVLAAVEDSQEPLYVRAE
jgi:hypothetical protein